MEGFTGVDSEIFQNGTEPGSLGTEMPQKLKQNVKLVYNFLKSF